MAIISKKLTDIVKKDNGLICPYCKQKLGILDYDFWDHQGSHVVIEMNCSNCHANWFEIFKFMHVEEPKDE